MTNRLSKYTKCRKGKWKLLPKIEEITGHAHVNTRKLNQNISTGTAVFLNQKRANVCEPLTTPGGTFHKLSSDVIFVMCLIKFPCPCPTSIFGRSFHFPFLYFVLFVLFFPCGLDYQSSWLNLEDNIWK